MLAKSVSLAYHKGLKDIKGILFLFRDKDNSVCLKDFTSIFYHLGTFNHTLKEQVLDLKSHKARELNLKLSLKKNFGTSFA